MNKDYQKRDSFKWFSGFKVKLLDNYDDTHVDTELYAAPAIDISDNGPVVVIFLKCGSSRLHIAVLKEDQIVWSIWKEPADNQHEKETLRHVRDSYGVLGENHLLELLKDNGMYKRET